MLPIIHRRVRAMDLPPVPPAIIQVQQSARPFATDEDFNKIVDAIYIAEGGPKAQYLYGIKSVKYSSPQEARRICFNTVRNTFQRWLNAGHPGDFIEFLGKRYCPLNDPADTRGLNKNWVGNVKANIR